MNKYLLMIGAMALINLTACSKDDKPGKPDNENFWSWGISNDQSSPFEYTYSVVDETLAPIAHARVLIGNALGTPFKDNFTQTDDHGQFAIPAEWTTPQNLTIDATGYLRVTYINETPKARQIILKKVIPAPIHEVKGITSGHPIKNNDDFIDFSLVMSAMSRQDLLNFDLNKVISPKMDTISIAGYSSQVPSNISLPKQKESYFIGITIEKPIYRLYFSEPGIQRIYAARGRFPFDDVVGKLRDHTEFYELINYFSITGGTVKDVQVNGGSTPLDINVMDMNYTGKLNVQAPSLSANQVMVAVSVADMNGYLIPTDVKRLNSKQKMGLSVLTGHPSLVAHVIKNSSEFKPDAPGSDRLSGVLLPFTDNSQAEFLSLITNPVKNSETSFKFQVPTKPNSVYPMATYAVLSAVNDTDKTATRVWEVYSKTWDSQIDLPQWPQAYAAQKKRVEVSFIGSLNNTEVEMGPHVIEAATHVTRSSVDY